MHNFIVNILLKMTNQLPGFKALLAGFRFRETESPEGQKLQAALICLEDTLINLSLP